MAKKLETPASRKAQSSRFVAAAREAGCSEDEAEIRENLRRIASPKPVTAHRDTPAKP